MNEELSTRPTSSGMRLRFAWRIDPEGPSGLELARKQFQRPEKSGRPPTAQPSAPFSSKQIRAQQAADATATWHEQLSRALDYRQWHRFEIERQQDGHWKRLTKKTYGTGSGGEKPSPSRSHTCRAAAHYRSASPIAPRLIMLDEAFVGIDSATRAKLMGLFETFDLDLVMTSEREWACYPTVSAMAIYQLSSHPTIDAVGVTRWVWNGRSREQRAQPASILSGDADTPESDPALHKVPIPQTMPEQHRPAPTTLQRSRPSGYAVDCANAWNTAKAYKAPFTTPNPAMQKSMPSTT